MVGTTRCAIHTRTTIQGAATTTAVGAEAVTGVAIQAAGVPAAAGALEVVATTEVVETLAAAGGIRPLLHRHPTPVEERAPGSAAATGKRLRLAGPKD